MNKKYRNSKIMKVFHTIRKLMLLINPDFDAQDFLALSTTQKTLNQPIKPKPKLFHQKKCEMHRQILGRKPLLQ